MEIYQITLYFMLFCSIVSIGCGQRFLRKFQYTTHQIPACLIPRGRLQQNKRVSCDGVGVVPSPILIWTPKVQKQYRMWQSFSRIWSVKYGALACLVLQNTFLVVYMHYSRVHAAADKLYASSTAVVTMEVVKFVSCLAVIAYERNGLIGLIKTIHTEIIAQPFELVKLGVPSVLYSVQNNLLYYALSHLDAATFQVGYQLKILTTAGFSYLMLGKYQSRTQILSLVLLTVGVSFAQLSTSKNDHEKSNSFLGLCAVIAAAITSGFAGGYLMAIVSLRLLNTICSLLFYRCLL